MYYLIKIVNNVPFILEQFTERESAEEVLNNLSRKLGAKYEIVTDVENTDLLISTLRDAYKTCLAELRLRELDINMLEDALINKTAELILLRHETR